MIIIMKKINDRRKITILFYAQRFQFAHNYNNILSLKRHADNENVTFSFLYKHLLRISSNNILYRD